MQDIKKAPYALERKHYIIAGSIIMLALALQPFALLFTQITLAPKLIPLLTGKNQDGSVQIEGKTISGENLKLRGDKNAQIILVEFSDYQCPFCARFHPTAEAVFKKYNGKVAWAWKHFPLGFHPEAAPTAIAAECVNKLAGVNAFWKFSDAMIKNQDKLSPSLRNLEASSLGINASTFAACLKDPQMQANVDKETAEGAAIGVNGTPNTFVVKVENGEYIILESINGALPEWTVDSIVEKYIN